MQWGYIYSIGNKWEEYIRAYCTNTEGLSLIRQFICVREGIAFLSTF
jgi:hypothetical protein